MQIFSVFFFVDLKVETLLHFSPRLLVVVGFGV